MHPTRNNLPPEVREKMIPPLENLLAAALDLYSQYKQAHWNVRGPGFIALHELFDKLGTEVNAAADIIAERILQLGSGAAGTVRYSAAATRLKEYPFMIGTGEQHAEALSSAIIAFSGMIRDVIDDAYDDGDNVTLDILIEFARTLDKQLWLIESHLDLPREAQLKLSRLHP